MKIQYIRKIIFFIFLMTGYAGLAIFSNNQCIKANDALTKKACKTVDKILYPAELFNQGLWELTKFVRIKLITGEFLTTGLTANEDTREKFKDLKAGFNFYYDPRERNNAGYLLLSRALPEKNGKPSIELWDLKNQKLINSYNIDIEGIRKKQNIGSQPQLIHPILLNDGSLIVSVTGGDLPLIKLDKCGKFISANNSERFHHSLEIDKEKRIYSPIKSKTNFDFSNLDDGYAVLDENLNILEKFSLEEIYKENYLANDIDKYGHLNDVQPFLREDGSYIILLSLRNQNRILAFNQDENKILWIIENAFSLQHDVDVISKDDFSIDISVFDNNRYKSARKSNPYPNSSEDFHNLYITFKGLPTQTNKMLNLSDREQHIKYQYSYEDFSFLENKYRPRTPTQGLSDFIIENNSLMIEDTDKGHLFEVDTTSNKFLWQYVNKESGSKKINYLTNWSRRLNKLPEGLDKSIYESCVN